MMGKGSRTKLEGLSPPRLRNAKIEWISSGSIGYLHRDSAPTEG